MLRSRNFSALRRRLTSAATCVSSAEACVSYTKAAAVIQVPRIIWKGRVLSTTVDTSVAKLYEAAVAIQDDPLQNNDEAAIRDIKLAADMGHPPALARVGRWHLFGLCGCEKDARGALTRLHKAAVAGDVIGQFWLGQFFLRVNELFNPTGEKLNENNKNDSAEERAAKAKAVMAEIKSQRRVALQNRARKFQNLPPLPSPPLSSPPSDDFEPTTAPLQQNRQLAYHWLLKAAEQDHADAQVALGNLCMADGDARQGIAWYELAAQVSYHTATPVTSEEGPTSAKPVLPSQESDTPPHPDALYNLGMIYYEGVPGVAPQDKKRAADYIRAVAEQLDPSALFWLGAAMHHGDTEAGIRVDRDGCIRNLELAASLGHPGAQHYLSRLYRNGDAGLKVAADPRKMKYFFDLAVENEYPDALVEMAENLYKGMDGYAIDHERALKLYEQAGAAGNVDALISAGAMYFHGQGTKQNYEKAIELYQQAGEQGSVAAWENVAAMNALGQGVPVNLSAATYIRNQIIPVLQKHLERIATEEAEAAKSATVLAPDEPLPASAGGCGKASCACKAAAAQGKSPVATDGSCDTKLA